MAVTAGLCTSCVHVKLIPSDRGSVFYQCQLSFSDPRFPKYPRLPVLECAGYQSQERQVNRMDASDPEG
jgi:hypothetical protein